MHGRCLGALPNRSTWGRSKNWLLQHSFKVTDAGSIPVGPIMITKNKSLVYNTKYICVPILKWCFKIGIISMTDCDSWTHTITFHIRNKLPKPMSKDMLGSSYTGCD